jgi:hypothetical protein
LDGRCSVAFAGCWLRCRNGLVSVANFSSFLVSGTTVTDWGIRCIISGYIVRKRMGRRDVMPEELVPGRPRSVGGAKPNNGQFFESCCGCAGVLRALCRNGLGHVKQVVGLIRVQCWRRRWSPRLLQRRCHKRKLHRTSIQFSTSFTKLTGVPCAALPRCSMLVSHVVAILFASGASAWIPAAPLEIARPAWLRYHVSPLSLCPLTPTVRHAYSVDHRVCLKGRR